MDDSFSDQALAQFLQIAPGLANAIVSFQDLSDEGPEGVRVGVFILQIGDALCYVPILGRGNSVTPPDSLFVQDSQQFFPLTKEIIARFATSLGSSQGKLKRRPTSVDQNPNIQQLVQPPRTGKYVYASSSRFLEFLSATSPNTRESFKRAIDSRPFAEKLFSVLNYGDIIGALTAPMTSAASETPSAPYILLTEDSKDIPMQYHAQIMRDGFAFMPTPQAMPRIVVEDGSPHATYSQLGSVDSGKAYPIVFVNSDVRMAFSPKRNSAWGQPPFVVFENGDYAFGKDFVTRGAPYDLNNVFNDLLIEQAARPFTWLDLSTPRFALLSANGTDLIGVFQTFTPALKGTDGSTSRNASCLITGKPVLIKTSPIKTMSLGSVEDGLLLIPENTTAVVLGTDVSEFIQKSVNAALKQEQHRLFSTLDSEIVLSHDGYEFFAGGKAFPSMKELMSVLVLGSGLDPDVALHFVKKAQATKQPIRLMLKSAASLGNGSFPAMAIPNFGVMPPPSMPSRLDAQRIPAKKQALDEDGRIVTPLDIRQDNIGMAAEMNDQETTEASIMAELLQTEPTDMINEYLPEIAAAINRLGRLLFILRLNTSDFIEDRPAAKISGIITRLKTVYKNLGSLYLQLGYIVNQ